MSTSHFWHAFSDLATAGPELVLERGEGAHLWDVDGRRYVDATAGLWFCNVGYGRREIVEAASRQLAELPAYSTFGDLSNRPASELAERVSAIAPVADSMVFFTSGGSDSVDTATKMARRYWQILGERDRTVLLRRDRAYHGMHAAGTSLSGIPANAAGYGELLEDVVQVPWDDAAALRETIDRLGPERVAAFFCEPVIGAGGVFPPPPGYLDAARQVCTDTGVLFVADEVITGFARCGDWFASTRFSLRPDLVTCAKGITSGYLPLGAVLVAPQIAEPFRRPEAGMLRHGYTYGGHAAVAAAALANLAVMEREDLCARARELEKALPEALASLADHPSVQEVRAGTGVLGGVQLASDRIAVDPAFAPKVAAAARAHGVLTRALASGALQVSPPLVIDEAGLGEIADGFASALRDVG
ncbi:MAG TPA: aminotransferase class III-fold pyridoxal phosphate-dependent enzyme [Actinomycetota bacterium]|jgi:adenosylmethionine-8-amino-7-oxononanoate aminotransferase